MPKMKDLGINVIPETMRPPECLPYTGCGCSHVTNPCIGCTNNPTFQCIPTHAPCVAHTTITICYAGTVTACVTHTTITICPGGSYCPGGSVIGTITITPTTPQFQGGGGLTRESIGQLKEHLHQQIAQLDEHAKTLGPQTSDEIDAREKQLKAELDDLASRRSDLKKK